MEMTITSLTTGTTRGLGREIFQALNTLGPAYWINRRQPELPGTGGWLCDLGDLGQVQDTCDAILRSNIQFNCLVLNAVHRLFAPIEQMPPAEFERALRVNVLANFTLLRAMLSRLSAAKGIVFICSSQAATHPCEMGSAYGSSKAAMDHLAEVFMYETRHRGIRTCILEMGAIRNREKGNDGWKMSCGSIARVVASMATTSEPGTLVSRMELRPAAIPLGDEAGPERLHRL